MEVVMGRQVVVVVRFRPREFRKGGGDYSFRRCG